MAARPFLFVLAGVNGAGKSSIGGHLLREAGLDWFNPDDWARQLCREPGMSQREANGQAWQEGFSRLQAAIAQRRSHAFETTLGGQSIAATLAEACATHDVLIWYCGPPPSSTSHGCAHASRPVATPSATMTFAAVTRWPCRT